MNDTGIGDIFERRHRHTGICVASLASIFRQLDVMTGRAEPDLEPVEILTIPMTQARRPTVAELKAYPISRADYPCSSRPRADQSLRRAHAQLEKGWLTKKEFAAIEDKCLRVIANQADKG